MDSYGYEGDDPAGFVPRLFERLREISEIEWREDIVPFHSSYDDWYAFGSRKIPLSPTGATKPLSPSLDPWSSSHRLSITSAFPGDASPKSPSGEYPPPTTQWIAARISRHQLRLEREYQMLRTLVAESDPMCDHHVQPLQAIRLPPRQGREPPLLVLLIQAPGMNDLREMISFGPNWYRADSSRMKKTYLPNLNAERTAKVEKCSVSEFLTFGIGAAECLEMLHQGNRIVHCELRSDAFHYKRASGKVKLMYFGSGVRTFEHGLTSAGWSSLSEEFGVEYKLQFIAPEQTGRLPAAPDSRTDIYSLGVIFWTMLTGDKPYDGQTPLEIMRSVLSRRIPPVSSRRIDVPEALSLVIQKMVQKGIEERYHSASGLKHDLLTIQQCLREGHSTALDDFQIASKDTNSFFNLPNIQVGRDEQHRTIVEIIQKVASNLENSMPSTDVRRTLSSNTSISDSRRESSAQVDDISDGASSHSRTSGTSTNLALMAGKVGDSLDSLQLIEEVPHEDSAWHKYSLDTRMSMNGTSNSSDFALRTGSAAGYSESNGSILRNAQLYKRKGRCEFITIQGAAGLGKSCLVQSIQNTARQYGYFASAKFDQMKRTPFEAVLKVMSSLFRQIFSESDVNTDFHHNLRSFVRPVWGFLHGMLGLPVWLLSSSPVKPTSPSVADREMRTFSRRRTSSPSKSQAGMTSVGAGHTAADLFRSGAASKNSRFLAILLDVLRFLSANKVILFCLDDLQFADEESAEVLHSILASKVQIILIATYREKEKLPPKVVSIINGDLANFTAVELHPLSEKFITDFVCATIHRSRDYVYPLVAVIYEKTNGNPFFIREMLDACYRTHCIWYSWKDSCWMYDLDKIFSKFESREYGSRLGNNFIIRRLRELPPEARSVVAWAALLGTTFSFDLVKHLMNGDASHKPLKQLGHAHLVRQSSQDAVKGLQAAVASYVVMTGEDDDQFRFCHDRYVQAATSLTECAQEKEMHFQIVQALMNCYNDEEVSVYDKSAHICSCINLVKSRIPERAVYRDLLFRAAEKSCESGGRIIGLTYYQAALNLLQLDPWDASKPDVFYQETLSLYARTAECYWLTEKWDAALELLQTTLDHVQDPSDKAPYWVLKSRVLSTLGQNDAAYETLMHCLAELGLEIPKSSWEECDVLFEELSRKFKSTDKLALLDRPLAQCRFYVATGAVLTEVMAMAYWTDALTYYRLALQEFRLNLDGGNISQAGLGYVHFAACAITRFNMIEFGIELGDMAVEYFKRFTFDYYMTGRGHAAHCLLIAHFCKHVRETIPIFEASMELSLTAGDRYSSLLSMHCVAAARVWSSYDVADVESFCSYATEEIPNWQDDNRGGVLLVAIRQYCRALQGKTNVESAANVLCDDHHDTHTYLATMDAKVSNPVRVRASYSSYRMIVLFIYRHIEEAIKVGERWLKTNDQLWSSRFVAANYFFLALSYAAVLRDKPERADRQELIDRMRKYHAILINWSTVSDVNYCAMSSIVGAELAEIDGHNDDAMRWYETALDHAEVHGFYLEQALAYELYGEFNIRRGTKRPARSCLVDAIAAYRRFSAFGKARHVSMKHEWLLRGTSSLTLIDAACQTLSTGNVEHAATGQGQRQQAVNALVANATINGKNGSPKSGKDPETIGLDMIDLAGILQSSQALSSELKLERLLDKLTSIIMESTGSELCAIVTEDEQIGWTIAAVAHPGLKEYEHPVGQPLDLIEDIVGKQVTLYCLRFKETVFLENVYDDDRFSNVPESFRKRFPDGKAIIATPILRDSVVLGCVYIHGPPHSFSERNLKVVNLLVNPIRISITNAHLFKKLERVSASNVAMIESQKQALQQAREAEKKAKLAEAEAMRNVKLKEEAARAKSMFLANVSHELRTPLNGVIGMSELLKGSALTSEQEGYADSIRVCADTLLTVINDILDFSKLEAGKMQIFSVPMSLTETISEVVRALSFINTEKNLRTIVKLDMDKDLLVMGDGVRIHQILLNLLSNAYKFTERGSVTVTAKVDREDERSISITCCVADTGVGVTEDQRRKLFLPFSQADSSTARSHGGTGLGLSICKAIIENVMKGRIWMESEAGVGTKVSFSLRFPKAPRSPDISRNNSTTTKDPMAIFTPLQGVPHSPPSRAIIDLTAVPHDEVRVCIAEDNPINQKIAISFIKKMGFQCEAFADGRQAVDALSTAASDGHPYHVVLMDCQMPVCDGYDATREIRKHPKTTVNQVLVIAMTASAIRGDREKCLDAGMNDYLAKPVRAQVLRQMLERYLAGGGGTPPAEASTPPISPPPLHDGEILKQANHAVRPKMISSNSQNGFGSVTAAS